MKKTRQHPRNHSRIVIAPLTKPWLLWGMKDRIFPVSPPEIKVRSAGIIGSFRSSSLMLLATPKAVSAVPKMAVAIQNLLVMQINAR